MTIGPGVPGLLGPNGAGKSTLIALMSGFLAPSAGRSPSTANRCGATRQVYRRVGLVPEREALFDYLTGREFVVANAESSTGLPRPGCGGRAGDRPHRDVGRAGPRDLDVPPRGCASGSRWPRRSCTTRRCCSLDEPFNGMDPRQRIHLMELIPPRGAEGRTVLFSSLHPGGGRAGRAADRVVVAGRHAASGDFGAIRRLMTDRPNRFVLRTADDRKMASVLMADPSVRGARLRAEGGIELEASDFRAVQRGAPAAGPPSTACACTR